MKNTTKKCPKCGEEINVRELGHEFDLENYTMNMTCNSCGHHWTEYFDVYYSGYDDETGQYDADGEKMFEADGSVARDEFYEDEE